VSEYEGWSRSKRRENKVYVAVSSPGCRKNRDIKRVKRFFENVAQFKYVGTTVTSQYLIQEEIMRKFSPGNAYYHSA
jgi:hypothetical protein